MRGHIIGRRISNSATKSGFLLSSSPFSTSSGRGRGRGAGGFSSDPGKFDSVERVPGKPQSDNPKPISPQPIPNGIGRGDGNFSSFISSLKTFKPAIGRGRATDEPAPSRPPESQAQSLPPRRQFVHPDEQNLPSNLHSGPSGVGRGRSAAHPPPKLTEENRHIRSRPKPKPDGEGAAPARPKFSREEAVKRAVSILSKGGGEGYERVGGSGGGRGRGIGRGRGAGEQRGRLNDYDDSYGELFLGNVADAEKLAERLGVENMQKLEEGFEELSGRVLPDPEEDAYVDAMHTNYAIEFEPEYLMGEFDQNPDIDEKPPMSIQEMLEKVKPFIMAYEGIESQEEWEEVVEETMKRVPLLKEIVDFYSGPDRVTAKKQQEELERVAKTITVSAPASVKQFTDRAVLSLQSNPGWGFDKKCQFMDKLVREVNQCYK